MLSDLFVPVSLSLIIPVRNEAETISALIDSIEKQTHPAAEIIFVDGGSADKTVPLFQQLLAGKSSYRVIEVGEATPGKGRNIGITLATRDWIALTDAGIRLEADWLQQLVSVVEVTPCVEVVYGNYEAVADTFFTRCAALVYVPPKKHLMNGWSRGPSVVSMLLRRDVWEKVGGFPDLRAAEDLMFMHRIEEMGFKIGWAPQATVWWQLRPDFLSTWRKFVLYSRANVLAGRQRYWHYGLVRYYLLSLPFLALWLVVGGWWLVVPLMIFLARVAKNIWVRRENRGWLWFMNPLQFGMVALIQLTVEMATFVGWAQAVWLRIVSGAPSRG